MLSTMSVTSMLDRDAYVYAEVDRLIGLPAGTAKRWINGYERGGKEHPPILRVMPRDTAWVTWGEFARDSHARRIPRSAKGTHRAAARGN